MDSKFNYMRNHSKLSDCFNFKRKVYFPYYNKIKLVTVPCIKCGRMTTYKSNVDQDIEYNIRCDYCRGILK